MGFLVKGVLYMVIGALALQVAANAGGRVTGTRGALTTVLGQPGVEREDRRASTFALAE